LLAWKRIHVTLAGGIGLLFAAGLIWLALELNIWLGRAATIIAVLAWWRWGKRFIWFPLSFWGVLTAALIVGWLADQWNWPSILASAIFSAIAVIFLWGEWLGNPP
jgi:hypothetical protein